MKPDAARTQAPKAPPPLRSTNSNHTDSDTSSTSLRALHSPHTLSRTPAKQGGSTPSQTADQPPPRQVARARQPSRSARRPLTVVASYVAAPEPHGPAPVARGRGGPAAAGACAFFLARQPQRGPPPTRSVVRPLSRLPIQPPRFVPSQKRWARTSHTDWDPAEPSHRTRRRGSTTPSAPRRAGGLPEARRRRTRARQVREPPRGPPVCFSFL